MYIVFPILLVMALVVFSSFLSDVFLSHSSILHSLLILHKAYFFCFLPKPASFFATLSSGLGFFLSLLH